jgi:hypothetical protein
MTKLAPPLGPTHLAKCTWIIQLFVKKSFGSKVVEVAASTQNEY